MAGPKSRLQTDVVEQVLPLVLEIIPGQAGEGLIDIYEPGSYEGQSLWKLCRKTLGKKNWSIEEQQILEDINRQLDGGRLLCRGQRIEGTALDYAVPEETEAGEKYLYVAIRAIKPQEGGRSAAEIALRSVHHRCRDGEAGKKKVGSQLPEMQAGAGTNPRAVRRDI